jgi:hypothetical protein
MAQEDYTIANADGATVRADINSHLSAIVSNNSGATAPATTFAFQFWADTSTGLLKIRNSANSAWVTIGTMADAFLGLADLDTAQTFTKSQRGTITTDNDLSFDIGDTGTNNFKCTPTGSGTLTFTNHTSGQSGNILLDNSGGHAISLAATTKGDANLATTISTAGTYWLSYYDDGTNAYVVTSAVFA